MSVTLVSLLLLGRQNNAAQSSQESTAFVNLTAPENVTTPHSLARELKDALAECTYADESHPNTSQKHDPHINREDMQTDKYIQHPGLNSDRKRYGDHDSQHLQRPDRNCNSNTDRSCGPRQRERPGSSSSRGGLRHRRSTYDSKSVALPACTILCVLTRLGVVDEMGFAKESSFIRLSEDFISDRQARLKQIKRITSCFRRRGSGLEDDNCAYAKKMALCIGLDMNVKQGAKEYDTSKDMASQGIALA